MQEDVKYIFDIFPHVREIHVSIFTEPQVNANEIATNLKELKEFITRYSSSVDVIITVEEC